MNITFLNLGTAAAMLMVSACAAQKGAERMRDSKWALHATPLDRGAADLSNDAQEHIAWARALRSRILEVTESRTVENTLQPYNDLLMHLDAAANECGLFQRIHPDRKVRTAAEEGERAVSKVATELRLDRELYQAILAVTASRSDDATRYFLLKTLRDYRRAGIDKSDEARHRIAALNDEIVNLGQEFARNIREDDREIVLDSPADLEGMPKDWIDAHPPGTDGKVRVSTRYPDYNPFVTYSKSADARFRLYKEFKNRAHPKNLEVLTKLLSTRNELATLLGYPNWADYITEDKMIETAAYAQSFVDQIAELSRPAAERDYLVLLDRKHRDHPSAAKVEDWEKPYYDQLVKSEQYAFDPQSVRVYFNYPDVLAGLFDLTQRLFGIAYRRVHGLNLWHESVTAWDLWDGDECIGRFYLDMHPRENKYDHAAEFDYRAGIAGVRLPQAVLVCNLPDPRQNKDGIALMEHDDVVTLFHEFGHLLHVLFAGRGNWMGNAGISTEWDFVEAPSQMIEEWCYNAEALRLFAKHYQTDEPIPAELVESLRRASEFGKGLKARHQMFYAAMSLNFYNRDPRGLDTEKLLIELQRKYSPFEHVPDTHVQCNFGHLDGYSAIYYTYMWSLVIAKDLFGRFESEGVLNPRVARQYRKAILDPGGSRKAAELIKDFLGRPYSLDAYVAWLNRT